MTKKIETKQHEDNAKFWQEGWDKGFTGFHQSEYNPVMKSYFADKELVGKNILVPLCGKSKDMFYLASKGANVIGVEVVKSPIDEFFHENHIDYTCVGNLYKSKGLNGEISIYHADFFDIKLDERIDFLYDRASNVALPECMRNDQYYPAIKRLISSETQILLLTMDHNGARDFGPPYPVSKEETLLNYPRLKLNSAKEIKSMDRFIEAGIPKTKRMVWMS